MLPGLAEGIEFYIRPDFAALKDPQIWLMAGSMAFFAIGLGPAFLLVYGSYLDKKADVTFDYLTVVSWNIMGCVLAGFVTVPAVVLFNLDKATELGAIPCILGDRSSGVDLPVPAGTEGDLHWLKIFNRYFEAKERSDEGGSFALPGDLQRKFLVI